MFAHTLARSWLIPARTAPRHALPIIAALLLSAVAGCGGGGGGGSSTSVVVVPAPAAVSIGQAVGIGNSPIHTVRFPVILSVPAYGNLVVTYSTSNETAVGGTYVSGNTNIGYTCSVGADFVQETNATITIASGQSTGQIDIKVCDPSAFTSVPAFKISLAAVSGNAVIANDAKIAYGLVTPAVAGSVIKLNDTGATTCGNGTALAACPVSTHPDQDALHGRDSSSLTNADADGVKGFSFAKLKWTAPATRAVLGSNTNPADPWDCVQDNVSGLIWEAKTDLNKALTYTHADALAYVVTQNTANLCGYNDWRLPTPQELAGLVNNSGSVAAGVARIDQTFFPLLQRAFYWTQSSGQADPTSAWFVDFASGLSSFQNKTTPTHALLVRGTTPAGNFTSNVDGTVTDNNTGLVWQRCSDGLSGATCATGTATSYTWQAALNRVVTLNQTGFAGQRDWRLPNRNELATILDYSRRDPAADNTAFPGFRPVGVSTTVWTSTPYADGTKSWMVDFLDGYMGISAVGNARHVMFVRGGL